MQNSDGSGESFDSLSLSSEEGYEDQSEIGMEMPQNDQESSETNNDLSCEVNPGKSIDCNTGITDEENNTGIVTEVDMDVEY
jgi:hypothetical protein